MVDLVLFVFVYFSIGLLLAVVGNVYKFDEFVTVIIGWPLLCVVMIMLVIQCWICDLVRRIREKGERND